MAIYSALIVTLFVAWLAHYLLLRATGKGQLRVATLLLSLSVAFFVYLYGVWLFVSVYLKYVFAALFVALALSRLIRRPKINEIGWKPGRGRGYVYCFLLLFVALDVLYFTGTTGTPIGSVNLSFPFRHGKYIIMQGGRGLPTNIFHYNIHNAVFAIDITKLNRYGNRAKHIFSTQLNDYEVFGDTIYSPCAGKVVTVHSNNPDNIPPHHTRGPSNTNQVVLATDSFYVFMGHMQCGKVLVSPGDTVHTGQAIGLAGNSGFSLEPHLHIQAHRNTHTGLPWYQEKQIEIAFSGKTCLLFDVFNIR